jgi:hypothetical protein
MGSVMGGNSTGSIGPLSKLAQHNRKWFHLLSDWDRRGDVLLAERHVALAEDAGGCPVVWDAATDQVSAFQFDGGDWEPPLASSVEAFLITLFTPGVRKTGGVSSCSTSTPSEPSRSICLLRWNTRRPDDHATRASANSAARFILRSHDPVERLVRDAVLSEKEAQLGRMFRHVTHSVQQEF